MVSGIEYCSNLTCSDSRLLLQFDKMKAGAKSIFGNDRYVLNPVQAICPVGLEINVLSAMNQLRSLMQHFRQRHEEDYRAVSIGKRLKGWVENNFISLEQLTEISPIPEV